MNVVIISNNSTYKTLFDKQDAVQHTYLWDELKTEQKTHAAVVFIDGETMELPELENVRKEFPDIPIYYRPLAIKSDLLTRQINVVSASHKIAVLSEYTTEEQVVDKIMNDLTNKDEYLSKRVMAFFGTHSGAGVSTTALNLARSLSNRVNEKVLVLSLNSWDPCDYFYQYKGHYLNDLKVDLNTQSLTPARLMESLGQYKTFYHLAGNRDIKLQRFYQPYEIKHLIDVAKEMFDVIIIDAGTHFDSAPTVQAYLSAGLKFLVTNQEEKGYRGYFPHVLNQLIEPIGGKSEEFLLVVNRYTPSNSLITDRALEEELSMTRVATLPDMEEFGKLANFQKQLLYDTGQELYLKTLELITNLVIAECKLNEKAVEVETKKEKRRLFGLF